MTNKTKTQRCPVQLSPEVHAMLVELAQAKHLKPGAMTKQLILEAWLVLHPKAVKE